MFVLAVLESSLRSHDCHITPPSEPVSDSSIRRLCHLTCRPEHAYVTVGGSGEGGITDGGMSGGWDGVSNVSRYAGFKQSMETTESLPLISKVKCLLVRLITLKGLLQW